MLEDVPDTHAVTNQVPPLEGYDVFLADEPLTEAVGRFAADWAVDELSRLGTLAGSAEAIGWGVDANRYLPELRTHDRYGHRIDEVRYIPAYHELMRTAVEAGLQGAPWQDERPGAHVRRAAGLIVWSQVDGGHTCPISMTYAAIPALRADEEIAAEWAPPLAARAYDPVLRPVADKPGAIAGMAMTEKQGGSDVRANTTVAVPDGAGGWLLTGHKWFCSAPMSDVFLMLAQVAGGSDGGGLTCFVVPKVLPDGTRNRIRIQRLKDKLGNRSNASSEIELDGAAARALGPLGRGVATIVEMVMATRLDCILGSAAMMRAAVAQASHHAAYRRTFGRELIDWPLMRNVLADLAVESEAATLLGIRLAAAVDAGEDDFRRLATAVSKYHVCKTAPPVVVEALECLGGNGYAEDSGMPRIYREAPLNSIWEGSGNVNSLDVLRAIVRAPQSLEAVAAEIDAAAGADSRLDAAITRWRSGLGSADEYSSRRLAESTAMLLQGALLVRYGHPAVADAFCASRLAGDWGVSFGTLPAGADVAAIVERARPKLS
jgi:putative acyl-CoA dehydrogenase